MSKMYSVSSSDCVYISVHVTFIRLIIFYHLCTLLSIYLKMLFVQAKLDLGSRPDEHSVGVKCLNHCSTLIFVYDIFFTE